MTRAEDFPNLGFDPAPGDLDTVRRLVSAIGLVSGQSGTAQSQLSRIGETDGIWVGKAADAFTESVSEIPPYLEKALSSLNAAHSALSTWETSLAGYQSRARKLELAAEAAASQVSATKSALDGLPSDTEGMTDEEKEDHKTQKKGKTASYDAATDELERIRSRARTLQTEFNGDAETAARQIKNAADDAPPKPNWFERRLNDLENLLEAAWDTITDPNFWKLIGDILADIAMVIGIICLLALPFGGIAGLALIGLWVGAGAFAAHAIALAGGAEGMTWQTLAWDAAGVFAGGIGLAGSRLAQSGRALVQAGRNLRATQGFAATLSRVGPGNWGNLARLPSGMANSLRGFAQSGQGWMNVATGNLIDWTATVAGAAFATGSNMNDSRWTDGKWTVDDLPVIGPISNLPAHFQTAPDVVAPGPPPVAPPVDALGPTPVAPPVDALGPTPIDPPTMLASAGDSFTRGLSTSQMGTAA
ncbi:putative T7SS-secreted protein [Streptomyces synnematoformans]|uniref:Putative T7SS secretion signal domain-containing protein n=1 Tax=Streptomyces synnematoformans TaxID=415721 RepID=A0ABN2YU54_9ACTN